jgi:hypothetical protein
MKRIDHALQIPERSLFALPAAKEELARGGSLSIPIRVDWQ